MSRDLLPDRLAHLAASRPDVPALYHRRGDAWVHLTWADYHRRVQHFAAACIAAGLPEHGVVAILAENRPEWVIAAHGTLSARGVLTGIYQTCSTEQIGYILRHSETALVVVETPAQYAAIRRLRDTLPDLRRVIVMDPPPATPGPEAKTEPEPENETDPFCIPFAEFLRSGAAAGPPALAARSTAIAPDDLASLIYTSGTTGVPKGVMLSHHNIAWTTRCCSEMVHGYTSSDCLVSYLPLAHIAEQMLSLYLPLTGGFPIYFAGGLEHLKEALLAARPTVFLGVPRVWEKFKAALSARFEQARGPKAALLRWARSVATRAGQQRLAKGPPTGLLALEERLAHRLVLGPLRAALGFDRMRCAMTGSAATSRDVFDFFLSVAIPLHEVYGQSEDCGPTTFNQPVPGETRLGTAGKPIPGVQVKLAPDGEILVKGDNVFIGYYKDPAATAAALEDGWLHSGDVGAFDSDGFLTVTDRKKDLIKTAGGKYAAPAYIEKRLQGIPLVSQALVIGEGRRYLTALLTLDGEAARAFAAERGLSPDLKALAQDPHVRAHVEQHLSPINQSLSRPETIKRFTLLSADFSAETGELTPTQKLRRKVVAERYAQLIEAMYAE